MTVAAILKMFVCGASRVVGVNWDNLVKIHADISNSNHTTNQSGAKLTLKLPSFYLINARSLLRKRDELSLLLNTHPLEVVAITE